MPNHCSLWLELGPYHLDGKVATADHSTRHSGLDLDSELALAGLCMQFQSNFKFPSITLQELRALYLRVLGVSNGPELMSPRGPFSLDEQTSI